MLTAAPPDLLLTGGRVVNVYSGEILDAAVAVRAGRITYVGPEPPEPGENTRVVHLEGRYVAPGLIEPHTHPWLYYTPSAYAAFCAAHATTTLVCDNLLFWVRLGPAGFRRMVDRLQGQPARFYWWLRVSPNTTSDDEETLFGPAVLEALTWPEVVGLSEVTQWTRLLKGARRELAAMARTHALGKRVDGHTAGASYRRLAALAAAGISACHEAISGEEALARLRLGFWTHARFSSLRPDLPEVLGWLWRRGVDTRRLLLTTDSASPYFAARHGAIDGLVRLAVEAGVPPVAALQMATVNAATYLGLDDEVGGIAPGRRADLAVFPDLTSFRPDMIFVGGEEPRPRPLDWADLFPPSPVPARLADPALYALPEGPVVHFESAAITRSAQGGEGLLCAALFAPDASWMVKAAVSGLAPGLDGLCSVTYGGHVLLLGRSPQAMAEAARLGPFTLVQDGRAAFRLELPYGGAMSDLSVEDLASRTQALQELAARLGYAHTDLKYSLEFLCSDFLPDLKLTPRGLVDVKSGTVLRPPQPL